MESPLVQEEAASEAAFQKVPTTSEGGIANFFRKGFARVKAVLNPEIKRTQVLLTELEPLVRGNKSLEGRNPYTTHGRLFLQDELNYFLQKVRTPDYWRKESGMLQQVNGEEKLLALQVMIRMMHCERDTSERILKRVSDDVDSAYKAIQKSCKDWTDCDENIQKALSRIADAKKAGDGAQKQISEAEAIVTANKQKKQTIYEEALNRAKHEVLYTDPGTGRITAVTFQQLAKAYSHEESRTLSTDSRYQLREMNDVLYSLAIATRALGHQKRAADDLKSIMNSVESDVVYTAVIRRGIYDQFTRHNYWRLLCQQYLLSLLFLLNDKVQLYDNFNNDNADQPEKLYANALLPTDENKQKLQAEVEEQRPASDKFDDVHKILGELSWQDEIEEHVFYWKETVKPGIKGGKLKAFPGFFAFNTICRPFGEIFPHPVTPDKIESRMSLDDFLLQSLPIGSGGKQVIDVEDVIHQVLFEVQVAHCRITLQPFAELVVDEDPVKTGLIDYTTNALIEWVYQTFYRNENPNHMNRMFNNAGFNWKNYVNLLNDKNVALSKEEQQADRQLQFYGSRAPDEASQAPLSSSNRVEEQQKLPEESHSAVVVAREETVSLVDVAVPFVHVEVPLFIVVRFEEYY